MVGLRRRIGSCSAALTSLALAMEFSFILYCWWMAVMSLRPSLKTKEML